MVLVIEWAYYILQEQEKEQKFLADIHGAKFKGGGIGKQEKTTRPLADVMGRITGDVRGQSKIGFERVKVSKEEMERRKKARGHVPLS